MAILNPYLSFDGNARDAIEFYKDVFGGELNVMTFGDMGATEHEGTPIPDRRRHARPADHRPGLHPDGVRQPAGGDRGRRPTATSASAATRATCCTATSTSSPTAAHIDVPLEKAPWGDEFGQVKDKFDVNWLVNIAGAPS